MYIRVNGHLKIFQGNRQIFAFSVRYDILFLFNLFSLFGYSFEVKCLTYKAVILRRFYCMLKV